MRGAFANGVLAVLEDAGHRDFDAVYGTSAGGALAAWWSAGQARYALGTWRYAQDPEILSYGRYLLRRGPLLDHDRLFEKVYLGEMPLDVAAIEDAPHPVVVTVTDADSGAVHYPDIRQGPVIDWLRAAGRLPLGTGPAVEVEGRRWLDGGLSVPIPIERAIKDGADEVVCILNNPPAEREPEPRLVSALVERAYPAVADLARRHHELHNQNVGLVLEPPGGVMVDVICPEATLPVGRLTRAGEKIAVAMEAGERAGAAWLTARA